MLRSAEGASRSTHDLKAASASGIVSHAPAPGQAFTKNRDRLLEGDIAQQFLAAVLADGKVKRLFPEPPQKPRPEPGNDKNSPPFSAAC
ncbi:MAG TPA: hypothetical protein VGM07_14795 [Stellaceae bacterium]|jgi:hypothetical protein